MFIKGIKSPLQIQPLQFCRIPIELYNTIIVSGKFHFFHSPTQRIITLQMWAPPKQYFSRTPLASYNYIPRFCQTDPQFWQIYYTKTKNTVYQHMQGSSTGTVCSPTASTGVFTPIAPSKSHIFGSYCCICSARAVSKWKLKSKSYADNTEPDSSSNMHRDANSNQLQSWCKGAALAAQFKRSSVQGK